MFRFRKSQSQPPAGVVAHPRDPVSPEPDPLAICVHCGRRCRVPVTRYMPDNVRLAYDAAGWDFMATCEEGTLAEHKLFGASYADVIANRIGRVEGDRGQMQEGASVLQTATQILEELARKVESQRQKVQRSIAKNDQVRARARDVVERTRELRQQHSDPPKS